MNRTLTALVLTLALFYAVPAQERFVPFADEGVKDASFAAFRARLIAAVKERDVKYLVGVLDPEVTASFGGDEGVADFRRFWKVDKRDSEFWDELLKVLLNGGYMSENAGVPLFAAPYTFTGFPQDLDPFSYSVVFGNSVALRDAPSLGGKVITRLDYNIVTVDPDKSVVTGRGDRAKVAWAYIKTLGGKRGYVSGQYVRSPVDCRAIFEKRDGKWRLTAFVAGD